MLFLAAPLQIKSGKMTPAGALPQALLLACSCFPNSGRPNHGGNGVRVWAVDDALEEVEIDATAPLFSSGASGQGRPHPRQTQMSWLKLCALTFSEAGPVEAYA